MGKEVKEEKEKEKGRKKEKEVTKVAEEKVTFLKSPEDSNLQEDLY